MTTNADEAPDKPGGDLTSLTKRRRKPYAWKPIFIEAFRRCGNPSEAARAAGVSRQCAHEARQTDERFAADWADVVEELADRLEAKATTMALAGDARVLLATLRALRPDRWGERARVQLDAQHGGTVAATLTADPAAVADYQAQLARIQAASGANEPAA